MKIFSALDVDFPHMLYPRQPLHSVEPHTDQPQPAANDIQSAGAIGIEYVGCWLQRLHRALHRRRECLQMKLASLTSLDLSCNSIGSHRVSSICEMFKVSSALCRLLRNRLQSNRTITSLNMYFNGFIEEDEAFISHEHSVMNCCCSPSAAVAVSGMSPSCRSSRWSRRMCGPHSSAIRTCSSGMC